MGLRHWFWFPRKVTLHEEVGERHSRALWARVDWRGDVHIEGQDLGEGTEIISGDGEYEWFTTVEAADVPRLAALLGGRPGENVIKVMKRDWRGPRSRQIERLLRESDIPFDFYCC